MCVTGPSVEVPLRRLAAPTAPPIGVLPVRGAGADHNVYVAGLAQPPGKQPRRWHVVCKHDRGAAVLADNERECRLRAPYGVGVWLCHGRVLRYAGSVKRRILHVPGKPDAQGLGRPALCNRYQILEERCGGT